MPFRRKRLASPKKGSDKVMYFSTGSGGAGGTTSGYNVVEGTLDGVGLGGGGSAGGGFLGKSF